MTHKRHKMMRVRVGRVAAYALAAATVAFCASNVHPCLAQGLNYVWTGPAGARNPSGDWNDAGNWLPTRGFPSSFADTATIKLESAEKYEVRVDRDIEVMRLTLDAESATLLPTGLLSDIVGRRVHLAPGGSLMLLRGRIEGNLDFLLQSASVDIGPGLVVEEGGRLQESPVLVARGTANSVTSALGQLDANSPEVSLLGDSGNAQLTLGGAASGKAFHLLEGASIAIDAARSNTATLTATDRSGAIRVVNAGEIATGSTLPHEGTAVLALELEQSLGGVLEVNTPTMLGPTRGGSLLVHRNNGNIILSDTLTMAPLSLLINGEGGAIAGTGTIEAMSPIANFGRFDPNVAVQGHLVNEATAMLQLTLRQRAPGVESDQLVVSGNLTLGGTLEIALSDGFSPQLNDTFQLISAGTVLGQFDRILLPGLPDDRAMLLRPTSTDVSLQITSPEPVAFDSFVPIATFSRAFGGIAPQSNWAIDLANVSGGPQQVVVTESENHVVQRVSISGGAQPQAAMTLHIDENASLAATSAITVGPSGHLAVAGGGEAMAPSFDIAGGTLQGGGTLIGDVHNTGLVSPVFTAGGAGPVGALTIDGDFVQEEGGVLEIDVLGLGPGEHDVLHVTGDFSLGGSVLLDLSDFQPTGSFTIEIIDGDGVPVSEEPMCDVIGNGKCRASGGHDVGASATIVYYLDGDLNEDGKVDRDDFAIWQMNVGFMGPTPPPSNVADVDNDGDVDGDDFLPIYFNFGKVPVQQSAATTVPEPATLILVMASLSLSLPGACRFGRRSLSRTGRTSAPHFPEPSM